MLIKSMKLLGLGMLLLVHPVYADEHGKAWAGEREKHEHYQQGKEHGMEGHGEEMRDREKMKKHRDDDDDKKSKKYKDRDDDDDDKKSKKYKDRDDDDDEDDDDDDDDDRD